jgi:hypothetical protein
MLQRVVSNRVERSLLPPAGSDFTGGDDRMWVDFEQAKRPQSWSGGGFSRWTHLPFTLSLRDSPVEVRKNLTRLWALP